MEDFKRSKALYLLTSKYNNSQYAHIEKQLRLIAELIIMKQLIICHVNTYSNVALNYNFNPRYEFLLY